MDRNEFLTGRHTGRLIAGLLLTALAASAVQAEESPRAEVPVYESVGVTRDSGARAGTATPGNAGQSGGTMTPGTPWYGSDAGTPVLAASTPAGTAPASRAPTQNSELFLQIQTLQLEVQELRGLVEELTHQVNKLAVDQQSQYRDLDGRIVALRGGAGPAMVPGGAGTPAPGGSMPGTAMPGAGAPSLPAPGAVGQTQATVPPAGAPSAGAQSGGTPAAGEREAYGAAFELMRARKFAEATTAFNRFVRDYPNSGYAANSFYWLGELYLAQNNMEQARQSFTQVLNLYPDSQKVPDSLYKLGVIQHRLGDIGRAREYLNRAVSQYPGSSAAALAQTYLSELQ
jgi:tol-pal system protein YbgF